MGYFSNGTEGEIYYDRFCSRCIHDKPFREREEGFGCPVWFAHLNWAYELCNKDGDPGKEMLDLLIPRITVVASDGIEQPDNGECRMFVPEDAGAAIEGQMRIGGEA